METNPEDPPGEEQKHSSICLRVALLIHTHRHTQTDR